MASKPLSASLELVPCTITDAISFIRQHHRHHDPPPSGLFAIGCSNTEIVVGVALVGRPIARMLQDEWTAEVIRLCCLEGYKNACSMLYGACWRAAKALGWRRLGIEIAEPYCEIAAKRLQQEVLSL